MKWDKFAIREMLENNKHLKIGDHEIQEIIHDMAHERMAGALATPHQARYLSLGQDDEIEVHQCADHHEIRSHFLLKTLDLTTVVPGDGTLTLDPTRRHAGQTRKVTKQSDYELFE